MPKKKVTIRISQSSLWFSFSDTEGTKAEPYEMKTGVAIAANLREAFSKMGLKEEGLSQIDVLIDSPTIIIPADLYNEDEKEDLLHNSLLGHQDDVILQQALPSLNSVMVYPINKDLKKVIEDNFPSSRFIHICSIVWQYLYRRSFTGPRMKLYAYFHDKKIDVFSFQRGRFSFTNSFEASLSADAVYFILNIWKLLGLDAKKDELHLVGETPEIIAAETELKSFIQNVYTINQKEDFKDSPIASVVGLPYDMILQLENH